MRKLSAALLILLLSNAAPGLCKKEDKSDGGKTHQLVDEIIEAVQIENKLSDDELAELKKKQHERMNRLIDVIADKSKMSAEDKTKLKDKVFAKKEEHHALPPELKEKLEQRFDFKNFSKQTTYQVLSDHLSDSDLKAILKFLKSPTGEKLFREGPDMIGQAIELSAEKYVPIILEIMKQVKVPPNLPPMLSPKDNNPEHRKEMMEKWKEFFKDRTPPAEVPSGPGKEEI